MKFIISDPNESDPQILELSNRLKYFYQTTTSYTAYQETISHDELYILVDPIVDAVLAEKGSVRILELGAGCTGYPTYLNRKGYSVSYTAHDITDRNIEYLHSVCNQVFIGDIGEITGEFDLIISTYVYEHVTDPRAFLAKVNRLLSPKAWHVIFCPRYDVVGYIPPSLRHLNAYKKYLTHVEILFKRILARFTGKPNFLVNTNPAVLSKNWFRDSDAVNLVSRYDVEKWHIENGFRIQRLRPSFHNLKSYILYNYLTLSSAFQKK